jgi:hypothetical protein
MFFDTDRFLNCFRGTVQVRNPVLVQFTAIFLRISSSAPYLMEKGCVYSNLPKYPSGTKKI